MFTHIVASIVTTQNKIKREKEKAEKEALDKNNDVVNTQPNISDESTNSAKNDRKG